MTVFNNIQKTSVILSWLAMHVFWNTWQKYKVAVLGQGSCTKIIIRLPPMTISKEEKYLISAMSIQVALFWMTGWYWKELPLHSSQETCKYALDSCNEWHCVTGTALQKTYIIWHCITIDSTLKFIPSKQYLQNFRKWAHCKQNKKWKQNTHQKTHTQLVCTNSQGINLTATENYFLSYTLKAIRELLHTGSFCNAV